MSSAKQLTRRDFCQAALTGAVGLAMPRWIRADQDGQSPIVFLEAESFETRGGWLLDQQNQDQLGSPYLLAHGWGQPVADARTRVTFPKLSRYHAWVRTRDWTGPWKQEDTPDAIRAYGSPGQFRLLINGKPVGGVLGEEGSQWHWQRAGSVTIAGLDNTVSLQDQTGFDGRCEAILFTADDSFRPPDDADHMTAWRQRVCGLPAEPEEVGCFDLVVVGGGIAGVCASLTAARLGLQVALVHNRAVLGGNSSSEIRVSPNSVRNVPPLERLGDVMAEMDCDKVRAPDAEAFLQGDRTKRTLVDAELNITLLLNHHVYGVEKAGNRIQAIRAVDTSTGRRVRLECKLAADCSGDANLGVLAGADFRVGRESKSQSGESRAPKQADHQVLGSTLHWYSEEAASPVEFPDCPWTLLFTEESCQQADRGAWNWETGFRHDQVGEVELVRDYMLRAIYGNWAFQVNHSRSKNRYAKRQLKWVGYVLGKRESRRLLGDVIYSQIDLENNTAYPDNCIACDWGIDIHVADPKNAALFGGEAFRSVSEHWDRNDAPMRWLPYRSLYSRSIDNLLMAGRNVSCTHIAFAWFRCQRTTGMMGEAIGMAASICCKHDVSPRGVYNQHLDEYKTLLRRGLKN